jgi:hypothetical protein
MSGRTRALTAVAAGLTLLGAAGASGGRLTRAPTRAGILFTDVARPGAVDSGEWLVTPTGRLTRLLDRRWLPWTVSVKGVTAASRAKTGGLLWLLSTRGTGVQVPGSATASCVAWSADGRFLSYVTGKPVIWARFPRGFGAWGQIGAVWIVRASAPRRPLQVATGLSALDACPAWSASGATLAYMIRPNPASGPWTLSAYRGGSSKSVATLNSPFPSIDYQTFAWAPDKPELVFVDGTSVYHYDGAATSILGQRGSLDPVEALSASRGFDISDQHVRFSPDGRFIAAGVGGATGVLDRDGSLVRVEVGGFDGWAGNSGALTLAAEPVITLRLYPLDGSPSRVIATRFKGQVATDLAGRWFAYLEYQDSSIQTLVFRRSDGTVIRRRQLARIFPQLVAAVSADRRTAPPAGGYSSRWAR